MRDGRIPGRGQEKDFIRPRQLARAGRDPRRGSEPEKRVSQLSQRNG